MPPSGPPAAPLAPPYQPHAPLATPPGHPVVAVYPGGAVGPGGTAYQGMYPEQAVPQTGTNGLAIGALVTGLMGLGPVPIGLGVGALVTLRRSRQTGKGLAITGIVLGTIATVFFGGLFVLGIVSADDDPYAAPDAPAASAGSAQDAADPVDLGDLAEGACFDDGPDDFEAITRPCTAAHDGEVFSTLVLGPRTFPGDRAVRDEAQASCDREFAKYVGLDVHRSRLETDVLYPDRSMWDDGYRDVMCLAYGPDGEQLRATVEGSKR